MGVQVWLCDMSEGTKAPPLRTKVFALQTACTSAEGSASQNKYNLDDLLSPAQGLPFCVSGIGDLLALFRCISCRYTFSTDTQAAGLLGAPGRVVTTGEVAPVHTHLPARMRSCPDSRAPRILQHSLLMLS